MGAYLALRVVSMPVLLFFFYGQAQHWFNDYAFMCYFFAYWAVYIASAVLLFFVCMEVFRSALSAFSGLLKLGIVVFRWAALVSVDRESCRHFPSRIAASSSFPTSPTVDAFGQHP